MSTPDLLQKENADLKRKLENVFKIQDSLESKLKWLEQIHAVGGNAGSLYGNNAEMPGLTMQSIMGNFGASCAAAFSSNSRTHEITLHKQLGIFADEFPSILPALGEVKITTQHTRAVEVRHASPDLFSADVRQNLLSIGVDLLIPFPIDRTFLGMILLGPRLTKEPYSREDISLISMLASSITIAARNFKLSENYLSDQADKFRIRGLLEQFVAPEVVEDLITGKIDLRLKGERRQVSIVTADIRGFTAMSERVNAELIVKLLNQFYEKMSDIVFANAGMVDKFIGDAVLAVFGAPIAREDDSARALRTATEMVKAFEGITDESEEYRTVFLKLGLGVGVTTGDVILGNLGSGKRVDYTVIGKAVNLSARLSAIARAREVLTDHETFSKARTEFALEELKPMVIKGIDGFVRVYRVLEESNATVRIDNRC